MSEAKDRQPKVGVMFLGRRRPGFDMEWGKQMEARVRAYVAKAPLAVYEPTEKVIDDASLRRVMAACQGEKVDALVLLQTTMGDGRFAPTLAQLWPDPLILWATPENPKGDMISSCSLVGAQCWASTLRQMGHTFELVHGDPDAAATQQRFCEGVRLAATVRGLKKVRLGIVGGHVPGFIAMSADPFVIHRGMGAQVQTYTLIDFSNAFNEISPEAISADVARFKTLGFPHKDTSDEDLPVASRLYLTMKWFFENENLDALTIREWPEMPNLFGQWPYLGVARLVDEGRALGIEGDADGALGSWIVESLGLGRCHLSDWLEHDDRTITLWHGGMAPASLCEPIGRPGGPRIAQHFNIKKPAVLESTLRADVPITVFRFWNFEGKYFLTAREGRTIKPRRHLMATNALAEMKDNPGQWLEEMLHAGMPHHVSVVQGHHAALLCRFARVMNMQVM